MTRYDEHGIERRKWVPWAVIGHNGGALDTKDDIDTLTIQEISASQHTTVLLARMVRIGRRQWAMRQ
jgi:hypothetical protein